MPFVSTVGGVQSVAGNIIAAQNAGAALSHVIVQNVLLAVLVTNQFNGVTTDISNTVLSVQMAHGFDIGVSTCTVELTADPQISNYSRIEVYCSAGTLTTDPHNHNGIPLRFVGINLRTEASVWPHTFSLVCKGPLYMASQLRIPPFVLPEQGFIVPTSLFSDLPIGVLLYTYTSPNQVISGLLNGPGTDAQAIVAILNLVTQAALAAGVPGWNFVEPGLIGGTSAEFGHIAPLSFLWPPYRSALDIIQQFDQICLGYRTYETYAGRIIRTQIYAYPYGPGDTALTEGVDVWEGSSGVRSVEQLFNAVSVEGATVPGGEGGIINYYAQGSNPFQPVSLPVIDQFSSPWIEASNIVAGPGLSAVDVANWRLSERNRELVTGQWITYRDDLFMPGRVININVPHTAVTENVWVQRVETRVTAEPVSFTQTIYGIGGGKGDDPPYIPPVIVY